MIELKSDSKDLWLLRYLSWIKWTGLSGMFLLFVGSIYVLTIPILEDDYQISRVLPCLLLGGFPLYMCTQCLKVIPYIRADVEFSHEEFSIYWPDGSSRSHKWAEVKCLKRYGSTQVLTLLDSKGKSIFAVTNMATSYPKFVEILLNKTGLTY